MSTPARAVLTLFMCVLLIGFGLCGAYGMRSGLTMVGDPNPDGKVFSVFFFVPAAGGIAIALACGWLIHRLWRKSPPGA